MKRFLAVSAGLHLAVVLAVGLGLFRGPMGEERIALEMETLEEVPRKVVPGVKRLRDAKQATHKNVAPTSMDGAGKGGESSGSGASSPYYRVMAKYPIAAQEAGMSGHVDFKIDISEDGSVENIRVIGGEHVETFVGEARRALSKWKYRPALDKAGQPIRRTDHFVTIDFKISDLENSG